MEFTKTVYWCNNNIIILRFIDEEPRLISLALSLVRSGYRIIFVIID